MASLEFDGNRHVIPTGESIIGSDASCFLVITGPGILPRHLSVVGTPDGQASVRRINDEAAVRVNGVSLGPQPAPLLHGDKLHVGNRELAVVDERSSGSTQFVTAEDIERLRALNAVVGAAPGAPAIGKKTASTGGRLVSLTDGREYEIGALPLVFGREAGCDVVIPAKKVSRRHAEIMVTPKGYVLVDMSSNGTLVNGVQVQGERVLTRADVISLGGHEFRFYADKAQQPAEAAAGARFQLRDTMHGIPGPEADPSVVGHTPPTPMPTVPSVVPPPMTASPAAAPPPSSLAAPVPPPAPPAVAAAPPPLPPSAAPSLGGGGILGNLIVRSGALAGHRFPISVPIVNIGRADYNDVVIPDSSVSSTHAKIQLREGIWVVVDLDSTNGTSVDGEPVVGEAPFAPGASIKLGDIIVLFESTKDDSAKQVLGTVVLRKAEPPTGGGGRD